MRYRGRVVAWFLALTLLGLLMVAATRRAGPWRAQVVDGDTGAPLEGVVVLAVWYKRYTSLAGWAGGGYYTSREVVTGPDGRFVIPAQWTFAWPPGLSIVKGPSWYIFKPGYGRWGFRGDEEWLTLPHWERAARVKEVWAQFTGAGAVLELPPLKTREERLQVLGRPSGEIPDERMQKYLEALERERINLGLRGSPR